MHVNTQKMRKNGGKKATTEKRQIIKIRIEVDVCFQADSVFSTQSISLFQEVGVRFEIFLHSKTCFILIQQQQNESSFPLNFCLLYNDFERFRIKRPECRQLCMRMQNIKKDEKNHYG